MAAARLRQGAHVTCLAPGASFAACPGHARRRLPPGRRSWYPHAESLEEEFVFILEGEADAWVDGYLHRVAAGERGVRSPLAELGFTKADVRAVAAARGLAGMDRAMRAGEAIEYEVPPARPTELLAQRGARR